MKFVCRQLDREGTEREVEAPDHVTAPDEYTFAHVDMPVGAVTFVECLVDGAWECWVVERIESPAGTAGTAFFTDRITADEARAEIARNVS